MGSLVAFSINTWTPLQVSVPAVSLAAAAAVLAVTQGAWLWSALFVWELARPPLWLLIVFGAAALAAQLLAKLVTRLEDEPPSAPFNAGTGPLPERRESV